MGNSLRLLRLVAVPLATALIVAACSGSQQTAARQSQPGPGTSSQGQLVARVMRFDLGDKQFGPVSTQVPAKPLGTTPTTVPGVTLQLYRPGRSQAVPDLHGRPHQRRHLPVQYRADGVQLRAR
jgi:hypothetical protein